MVNCSQHNITPYGGTADIALPGCLDDDWLERSLHI